LETLLSSTDKGRACQFASLPWRCSRHCRPPDTVT